MVDVESMYYQVMVPDNLRSFLKFCGGIMVTSLKSHRILRCVHMYLVGHHLQVAQTMFLEELL